MQCKDIPDLPILLFLTALELAKRIGKIECDWANRFEKTFSNGEFNPRSVRHAMPDGIPGKLVVAKMGMLIRRRLVDGCTCGCRGDFVLTDKGRAFLASRLKCPVCEGVGSYEEFDHEEANCEVTKECTWCGGSGVLRLNQVWPIQNPKSKI